MSKYASPLISLAMGALGAAMFAAVTLQPTTPGAKETGNINVSGTVIGSKFMAGLSSSASIITAYSSGGGTTAVQGSAKNFGMRGQASATTGLAYGGYFDTLSADGYGAWVKNKSNTGTARALLAETSSQQGVAGDFLASAGDGLTIGVRSTVQTVNTNTKAIVGVGKSGYGGFFTAPDTGGYGLYASGSERGVTGFSAVKGVYGGTSDPTGIGVYGILSGTATTGSAIHAIGDVTATGTKSFKIDHPSDPENKYLYQFCSEGDTPQLQYRGTVKLDSSGGAIVELPSYFDKISRDPSYQLTPIGAQMNLYVADEVKNNRFRIAGGKPGLKVSWLVIAIRNDRYVQKYGARTEREKPAKYRGTYLQPELYGEPQEKAEGFNPKDLQPVGTTPPPPVGARK